MRLAGAISITFAICLGIVNFILYVPPMVGIPIFLSLLIGLLGVSIYMGMGKP